MKVHISKEDMVQIDQQEMMAPDSICFQYLNISSRSDIFVGLQQLEGREKHGQLNSKTFDGQIFQSGTVYRGFAMQQ